MIPGDVIFSRLTAVSAVTALVGTRIYPSLAPQDSAKPYVVYAQDDFEHFPTFGGPGDLMVADMQLGAWATTQRAASIIRQEMIKALVGYRPISGNDSPCFLPETASGNDGYDSEVRLYASTVMIRVPYLLG